MTESRVEGGARPAPRSVVVLRGEPAWASVAPHPAIARHVSSYWTVRFEGPRHTIRSLPDGCADVAFDLLSEPPRAFVTGPQPRARTVDVEGASHLFGVRFAPGAAAELLGGSVGEADRWVPLERWLSRAATRLARAVRDARDLAARAALLDGFFLEQRVEEDVRLARAIRIVFESAGAVRIGVLAKAAGASERTLGRIFVDRVGTTPKRFARMARFQFLLRRLTGEDRVTPDWGRFASEAGYADQAHMIREFKALFGCTPTEALGHRVSA